LVEGDLRALFRLPKRDLMAVPGMTESVLRGIGQNEAEAEAEADLALADEKGVSLLRYTDKDYPQSLKEISDRPPLLYMTGELPKTRLYLACVGTRLATPYGLEVTEYLCKALSQKGVTIVSGLARGIDAVAHQTAIKQGGCTVAVVGNGLSQIYPRGHRKLYEEIPFQGAVLSEFPMKAAPLKAHFPRRNRIVSGLSHGVLVIEAPIKSGALITARFALEQNRDVFCVPGRIQSQMSEGTHMLIQQGAKLVTNPEDLLSAFDEQISFDLLTGHHDSVQSLNVDEKKVLSLIDDTHVFSEILEKSSFDSATLSQHLLQLELGGLIRRTKDQHYLRRIQ